MPTLRDVFAPLIAYTLLLTGTPAERSRPFADIRREIEAMLEAEESVVKREEISQQDYNSARFAIVAWVDEMIMRCPELSAAWRGSLLQAKFYGSTNAGEEFFERLASLSTSQQQVIEIYHLALCLGFRGRYYDESQEAQLLDLRRQYGAHLPTPLIDPLDFEKRQEHVTPQPYSVSAPPFEAVTARPSPIWLALPALGIAGLLLWYFVPRGPSIHCLENAAAGFDCASILPTVDQGAVTLTGHISSDEEHSQVLRKLVSECAVKAPVTDQLSMIPPPFCRVMELLAPLQDDGARQGFGLKINPSKGCDTSYIDGEHIAVEVNAKKPLRYLYVDYYDAGREKVTHLLPNQHTPDNSLNDAQNLTLPKPNDNWQLTIQYPFGREMFTAVSSPRRLFPSPRPADESASDYLASLKEEIKTDGENPGRAAAYCFTMSAARPSGAEGRVN